MTFRAHVVPSGGTPLTGPQGQVKFYASGTYLGFANVDASGNADFPYDDLGVATYAITAIYQGDDTFAANSYAELNPGLGGEQLVFGHCLPELCGIFSGDGADYQFARFGHRGAGLPGRQPTGDFPGH